MQFSKFMPLVCAAAFCGSFISVLADDNPAQAAARAALMQKMNELDAQQASTNAAPPPMGDNPSAAAVAQPDQPVISVTASGATQEQPAATTLDNDAQARALAALQQKMSELDKQTPSTAPETSLLEPEAPEIEPAKPADADYPGKTLGLKPIEAPPLPVSAEKQAQLQALLVKYKADEVTPDQYQTERAKILAEP
jgi:hypothetical protein